MMDLDLSQTIGLIMILAPCFILAIGFGTIAFWRELKTEAKEVGWPKILRGCFTEVFVWLAVLLYLTMALYLIGS